MTLKTTSIFLARTITATRPYFAFVEKQPAIEFAKINPNYGIVEVPFSGCLSEVDDVFVSYSVEDRWSNICIDEFLLATPRIEEAQASAKGHGVMGDDGGVDSCTLFFSTEEALKFVEDLNRA